MKISDVSADRSRAATVRAPWVTFTTVWLVLTLMSSLWSLATPIAGSPDEPAHMVKAASVARGQWVGDYTARGHVVQVPQYVADTHRYACFAFNPLLPVDCAVSLEDRDGSLVDSTTTAGLYNPLYYALVGWPTLIFDDIGGIYAMRLMSSLVCSAFGALAFMALRRLPSPRLALIGFWTAVTPMAFFLFGSVNPNGFEAAAVLCFLSGMLGLMHSRTGERIGPLALIAGVGFAAAANARGLSLMWLVAAAAIAVVAVPWQQFLALFHRRAVRWLLASFVVTGGIALLWLLGSNSLGTSTIDADPGYQHPHTGASFAYGFLYILARTFSYAEGVVGVFGWQETRAPVVVYFIWAVISGALILLGLIVAKGRALVMLSTALACFLLLPPFVQGLFISSGGLIWQGRYNLPLFMCLVIAAAVAAGPMIDRVPRQVVRRGATLTFVALALAQLCAFAAALHRYAVGMDGSWVEAFFGAGWQAPGGNVLLCVAMATTAVSAVVLGVRSISNSDRDRTAEPPTAQPHAERRPTAERILQQAP